MGAGPLVSKRKTQRTQRVRRKEHKGGGREGRGRNAGGGMLQEYLECRCADLDSCRDAGGSQAEMIGNRCSFKEPVPLIAKEPVPLIAGKNFRAFSSDWKKFSGSGLALRGFGRGGWCGRSSGCRGGRTNRGSPGRSRGTLRSRCTALRCSSSSSRTCRHR